jgi:hypothetical protein
MLVLILRETSVIVPLYVPVDIGYMDEADGAVGVRLADFTVWVGAPE